MTEAWVNRATEWSRRGITAFGLIHSVAEYAVMITFRDAKLDTLGGQDHDQRRLLGFGLMLGGIAPLGAVTATLASWLIESVQARAGSHHRVNSGEQFHRDRGNGSVSPRAGPEPFPCPIPGVQTSRD
jgi:hypothetical protein